MKPLGIKSYGSIPHFKESRLGPGDHYCDPGISVICLEKARYHDMIIVTEKLDGSNCAVAKKDGQILALTRAGYLATTSPYKQHHLFAYWVRENQQRFNVLLNEGERACGEWLAQAHGTRYDLQHEPFVIFDLMTGHDRTPWNIFISRVKREHFVTPQLIHRGTAISIRHAMSLLNPAIHRSLDGPEGLVYRLETNDKFNCLAKYVLPRKIDGLYLTGKPESISDVEIWQWLPDDLDNWEFNIGVSPNRSADMHIVTDGPPLKNAVEG